jgi:two-component system, cell cycle response regulator
MPEQQRKAPGHRLSQRLSFCRDVWNHHPDNMFLVRRDRAGDLVLDGINPAMEAEVGIRNADVAGSLLGECLPYHWLNTMRAYLHACLDHGLPIRHEEQVELPGSWREAWSTLLVPVNAGTDDVRVLGLCRRVAGMRRSREELERLVAERTRELEEANRQLQALATTDVLTDCFNRRHLFSEGARAFAAARRDAQPLSVLMLDIDHFKRVNDRHGHAAGDAAIRQVAVICQELLRDGDMLGRYGGDEFAAVLPGLDACDVRDVAERLRSRVETLPVFWRKASLRITVSMGTATLDPTTDGSIDDLFDRADLVLLQAKQRGRNRVVPFSDQGS